MTAADRCPPPADLEALLLGRAAWDAAADLERHLADCPACAARAGAVGDDGMVAAVRRAARDDTPLPELTDELVTVIRRAVTVEGPTATWAGAGGANPPGVPDRVGPYAVRGVLGAGGMGVVYEAFDPTLQRTVAVKVIRPGLVAAPGMVERFLAEARAAAAVEHDGIVVVHAAEVHDGRPCLVMPLLKGRTLEARLRGGATLPPAEAARVGREAAAALAAAHAAGLVHRDIKPGNLWLEAPTGRVKVLDFGLAATAGGAGGFAGTPGYMAPEQVRGEGIDPRADLFGLGCVLYRALTGAGPFDAETATGAVYRTLTATPAGVRAANPAVPPALAGLVARLLARAPADRPESAAAVEAELAALAAACTARRRAVVRRRWLAGLVAAAGVGGLAAWLLQEPAPEPVMPVEVTVVTDPDCGPLVLAGADGETTVAGGRGTAVSLMPGTSTVRAAAPLPGRVPVPAAVVVRAAEPARVRVALVGEVAATRAHSGPVTGVAVVRDGDGVAVLSASLDRTLQRWEPGKGDPRHVRLDAPAECVAASADGGVVLTAGGSKARLTNPRDPADPFGTAVARWDGRTLRPAGDPLAGHDRIVRAVAVSHDGRHAVSADADAVIVWNLAAGTHVRHASAARALAAAFAPDGRRALTGDDAGRATLWDATAPAKALREFGPVGEKPSPVRAVGFVPDGFVTGCDDGAVWLWDREFRPTRLAAAGSVLALAASPDGRRVLTAGADGAVRLWSAPRGELVQALAGHAGPVRGVAFTPDGRGATSAGEDRTVRLWRLPFE